MSLLYIYKRSYPIIRSGLERSEMGMLRRVDWKFKLDWLGKMLVFSLKKGWVFTEGRLYNRVVFTEVLLLKHSLSPLPKRDGKIDWVWNKNLTGIIDVVKFSIKKTGICAFY